MSDQSGGIVSQKDILRMTVRIASAYFAYNPTESVQISDLVSAVHGSIRQLAEPTSETTKSVRKPAVAIKKSVAPNYIVCLEDGRRLKMLKRHLKAAYGLTPEEYRRRWNLPTDYPMVAPRYAQQRSQFAKKTGLGKNRASKI